MAGYLIDTNVVSELRKGPRTNGGVSAWFTAHASDDLWLSVLVVGELRRGAALVRRRDPDAADRLDDWLATLEQAYADRILPIDGEVARRWAALGIPDPLPVIDGLIAATALRHDLVVVTRNEIDLARCGARYVNPFD